MTKHFQSFIKGALLLMFLVGFTIPRANARVLGDHYIDAWGALGYSALFQSIENSKMIGGPGVQLGLTYEWRYKKKFLLTTGLEFAYYGNNNKYSDFDLQARSEERRAGKECTPWCSARWSPYL